MPEIESHGIKHKPSSALMQLTGIPVDLLFHFQIRDEIKAARKR
jgi:hypothetical protein